VRKQYHFWPGEHGLNAWDLDRLIELSSGLPVKDVDLASIEEIGSVYRFDDRSQRATVRSVVGHIRLIEEVDLSHPIILGRVRGDPGCATRTRTGILCAAVRSLGGR
jgi:hypothetical protein